MPVNRLLVPICSYSAQKGESGTKCLSNMRQLDVVAKLPNALVWLDTPWRALGLIPLRF